MANDEMNAETSKLLWRLMAGFLAVFSIVLVIMQLFAYSMAGEQMVSDSVMELLRLLFPTIVALISGFIAVRGKIPYSAM